MRIFLLCLLLFIDTFGQVLGQTTRMLADAVTFISPADKMVSLLGCGGLGLNPCYNPTVENPGNALIDDGEYARLLASPGLLATLGSYDGELELQFPSTVPPETWSYVRIGADESLLQALLGGSLGELLGDVLGSVLLGNQEIEIQARNSSNVIVESRTSTQGFDTDGVKLVQDGSGNYFLAIKPSVSYDRVRLINRSITLVGLGTEYTLDVYNAFYYSGVDPCGLMPTFTSYDGAGVSLDLLNLNDLVLNPFHAIDNDPATYSQISLGVLGVAATTEQFIYFTSPVQPGNDILVSLATSASLVDLGLLNNVYLVAYSNGAEVESVAASSLVELDLLGLLDTDSFLQFPLNHESAEIDQIGIRVSSLADAGLLAGGLQIGAVTVVPSPPEFEPEHETGLYTICQGDEQVIVPLNESGRVLNWYSDYEGEDFIGQADQYALQDLPPGDYDFYVRSEYQSCSGEGLPAIFSVTVNPHPYEEDIIIDSQGGVLELGNKIIYPVGVNVVLTPDNSLLPSGSFEWYSNEEGDDLDGLEIAGATFTVENEELTISNTNEPALEQEIFLGYETSSGCKTIKQFSLESFIILPSVVYTFNARSRESGQVDLDWELSNEQQQGTVTIQRASASLEFAVLASLPIVPGRERIRMKFTDYNPLSGRNYYRLSIVKESGSSTFYSEVRMAEINELQMPAVEVFPNPFTENFAVKSTIELQGSLSVSLLSTQGTAILSQTMDSLSRGELIEFRDLGDLPAGVYVLRLKTLNGNKSFRVIKQNGSLK
ncbi:T9SS type A sorting domain-containing protein [Algoriphagus sp. Y33]|uniref:T9SS type A sorting domain-containing protein n=1 Tax=Algoriphagus sp. Y33 TaxID=2772483 RepID=UPI001785C207|nr:T9SS type A sorting domain-containing protein [Algoriphagus sp. Y33]